MFQIGYYITNTNVGKVLDARVEPVLSSSAVANAVSLSGPLVHRLFYTVFSNNFWELSIHFRNKELLKVSDRQYKLNTKCSYSNPPEFQNYIRCMSGNS